MRSDFLTLQICSLFVAGWRIPSSAMMQRKENTMSIESRRDLQTRIKELETENEELQTRLDEISDIVAPADEDEEDDDEAEDDDEGDESGE